MVDDFVLTVNDVMRELKTTRPTLLSWRKSRNPPEFRKCGLTGKIRYSASSVLAAKQRMYGESNATNNS